MQGRRLESHLGWILRTLQGGRVVLGQVRVCIGYRSILLVEVGKNGVGASFRLELISQGVRVSFRLDLINQGVGASFNWS